MMVILQALMSTWDCYDFFFVLNYESEQTTVNKGLGMCRWNDHWIVELGQAGFWNNVICQLGATLYGVDYCMWTSAQFCGVMPRCRAASVYSDLANVKVLVWQLCDERAVAKGSVSRAMIPYVMMYKVLGMVHRRSCTLWWNGMAAIGKSANMNQGSVS